MTIGFRRKTIVLCITNFNLIIIVSRKRKDLFCRIRAVTREEYGPNQERMDSFSEEYILRSINGDANIEEILIFNGHVLNTNTRREHGTLDGTTTTHGLIHIQCGIQTELE